jgi:hypothetical protein
MYTANEYVDDAVNIAGTPIVVIGFHSKYKNIFRKNFDISEGKCCEDTDSIESTQRPNLEEWLPKIYKQK